VLNSTARENGVNLHAPESAFVEAGQKRFQTLLSLRRNRNEEFDEVSVRRLRLDVITIVVGFVSITLYGIV
jgi:hypothetical protein